MLQQGDIRYWSPNISGIEHIPVVICGLAIQGAPFIGQGYIVQLLKPIEAYSYTHVVALEVHLS